MSSNYYQILGVTETAGVDEIKKAYRRLAREFHPDVTQTPEAEANFKEINRAYDILSDSVKRADYDANLHPQREAETRKAPMPGTEEAYAWQPSAEAEEGSNLSRIAATVVVFVGVALILEFFLRWAFPENPLSQSLAYALGLFLALVFGLFWGVDNNVDISAKLGPTVWGRVYTFLRSIFSTLTFFYFLGLIGAYLDNFIYDKIYFFTPILSLSGAILGATLGSSDETPSRLSSPKGRFELFSILLRGLEVGVISALLGGALGAVLLRFGYKEEIFLIIVYISFILGIVLGSINPPNLSAYASYISASIKNVVIFLLIAGTLLLGLTIGIVFADTFKSIFDIIKEGLIGIIGS